MIAPPQRRRAIVDPPACEGLEPRRLLATFSTSSFFSTNVGYDWGYQTSQQIGGGAIATGTSVVQSLDAGLIGPVNVTRFREVRTALGPTPGTTLDEVWGGTPAGIRLFSRTSSLDESALRYGAGLPVMPLQLETGRTYAASKFVQGTVGDSTASGTISSETTVGAIESITVPAGTFDALRVSVTLLTNATLTNGLGDRQMTVNESITLWLIDGVRVGREERTTQTTIGSSSQSVVSSRVLSGSTVLQQLDSIQVSGRGVPIAVADDAPSTVDGTNFTGIDIDAQTKTRVFVIRNVSTQPVTLATPGLSGDPSQIISISGTDADDFQVLRAPTSTFIAPGQTQRFSVRFNPSALGFRHGVVRFSLAGNPNALFSFAIRGTGVNLGRIDITRNGTVNGIPQAADTSVQLGTFFGNIRAEGDRSSQRTYRITNFGLGSLRMLGTPRVAISGPHAADFVVTAQPLETLASDAVTLFVVRFNPSALGTRTATLSILTNDPTRPIAMFGIGGVGV